MSQVCSTGVADLPNSDREYLGIGEKKKKKSLEVTPAAALAQTGFLLLPALSQSWERLLLQGGVLLTGSCLLTFGSRR